MMVSGFVGTRVGDLSRDPANRTEELNSEQHVEVPGKCSSERVHSVVCLYSAREFEYFFIITEFLYINAMLRTRGVPGKFENVLELTQMSTKVEHRCAQ
jgi:hypothetical protein